MQLDADQLADLVAAGIQAAVGPILTRLALLEARELVAGPPGRDGKDGRDGREGKDGKDALDGKDGAPGRDGKDGKDALDGKDGAPGRDGKDGTLEGLRVEWADERTLRFLFPDGTVIPGSERHIPLVLYRGVYDGERTYAEGDQVTCGGSTWIAKTTTTQRPDEDGPGARDWQLCAKRGPMGPRGPKGDAGLNGKDGSPGRDLTQMDSQGRKW